MFYHLYRFSFDHMDAIIYNQQFSFVESSVWGLILNAPGKTFVEMEMLSQDRRGDAVSSFQPFPIKLVQFLLAILVGAQMYLTHSLVFHSGGIPFIFHNLPAVVRNNDFSPKRLLNTSLSQWVYKMWTPMIQFIWAG